MSTLTIDISRARAIEGWMQPSELRWLAEHAKRRQRIIEFGSYRGRSTRAMADHCPGVVYAVDPWDDTYYNDDSTVADWFRPGAYAEFQQHLADHLATGRVVPLRMASEALIVNGVVHPDLAAAVPVDLVFIDGDHRVTSVRQDIQIALELLRPGGVLAGHDYGHPDWPGVQIAVDELGADVQHVASIWWLEV